MSLLLRGTAAAREACRGQHHAHRSCRTHAPNRCHRRGLAIHIAANVRYNAAQGGGEVHALILAAAGRSSSRKPPVVLMESFAAPNSAVEPGGAVPYQDLLVPADGLAAALALVGSPLFRAQWSAESVAVLAALQAGGEVRLCDRLAHVSFDRLVGRRSLDQLRKDLAAAVEAVAQQIESGGEADVMPQNAICPLFPGGSLSATTQDSALLAANETTCLPSVRSGPGSAVSHCSGFYCRVVG
eukprot:SAG22_NODE_1439_length_4416_cov_25.417940_4_plen_242_part_00